MYEKAASGRLCGGDVMLTIERYVGTCWAQIQQPRVEEGASFVAKQNLQRNQVREEHDWEI